MDKALFAPLKQGLREAAAIRRGDLAPARSTKVSATVQTSRKHPFSPCYSYKGNKDDAERAAFLFERYQQLTSLLPAAPV